MNNDLHFSSKNTEWSTPQDFFDRLDGEFNFTLDAASTAENAKCEKFFTITENGLDQDWSNEVVFLNPPYGRKITGVWVKKAYEEAKRGATVVCLLPAKTDTKYFHDFCLKGEVRFIKGRIKFVGNDQVKNPAPFPSMVVIFR